MVNPKQIIDFTRNDHELEELALFCIAVAGKTALSTANAIDKFLARKHPSLSPFDYINLIIDIADQDYLAKMLKDSGIGCYTQRARSFADIASRGINLRACTVQQLEEVVGIGQKTSRAFMSWSRPHANYAILDVHVLRWMNEKHGIEIPKWGPKGKKYEELETQLLSLVPEGMTAAEFDHQIWMEGAGHEKETTP